MSQLPFTAVVGQTDVASALLIAGVDPTVGGVLLTGEKGTAKTTLVRAFADLLPDIAVIDGCRFSCDPASPDPSCPDGPHAPGAHSHRRPAKLIELPLGASDDRVTGSLDVAKLLGGAALADSYSPGLLAAAHRGVLFIDEVNLLPDALVDLLLDAAATGRVIVEREGISLQHSSRFVLVGTMNPEEGELRPQLLDRFGLCVPVVASQDPEQRTRAVRARLEHDRDPSAVAAEHGPKVEALRAQVLVAQQSLPTVDLADEQLLLISRACVRLGVEGLRGDLVTARAATALAALREKSSVDEDDIRDASRLTLIHRRRTSPFDEPGIDEQELDDAFTPEPDPDDEPPEPDPTGGELAPSAADGKPSASPDVRLDLSGGQSTTSLSIKRERSRAHATAGRGAPGPSSRGRASSSLPAADKPPHLLPTLRAAASRQHELPLRLRPEDARRELRNGRHATFVVLLVDTSGSMAARKRAGAVADAALALLHDSYRRRDRLAVVAFDGSGARVVVPTTGSTVVAKRGLDGLRFGGRTPLSEALELARALCVRERRKGHEWRELVVVVSDGRATAGADARGRALTAAHRIATAGIESLVIDAEEGFVKLGLARELASALGGQCISLPGLGTSKQATQDLWSAVRGKVA